MTMWSIQANRHPIGEGTDTVHIGGGLTSSDISMWIDNGGYLNVQFNAYAYDSFKVQGSLGASGSTVNERVERIQFDNATYLDLTSGLVMNDTDDGHQGYGTAQRNVIDGRGGNDTIDGRDGDDTIYGGNGVDTLTGGNGADQLFGNAGNDRLLGGADNNLLYGGDGLDTLTGGVGADVFVFEMASAYNDIDVISDFAVGQSDVIDISDLFSLYDPVADSLTNFVEITTSGANSVLKVDRDGTGTAYGFTQVAVLSGVGGLTDEESLVANGNLVVI